MKKAEDKWWNRLLKQEGKPPVFLKVDWDKWVDEDEEEPENKCVLYSLSLSYNSQLMLPFYCLNTCWITL